MNEKYEAAVEAFTRYRVTCRRSAVKIVLLGSMTVLLICVLVVFFFYWCIGINMRLLMSMIAFLATTGVGYSLFLGWKQFTDYKKRTIAFYMVPAFEKLYELEFENEEFADAYKKLVATMDSTLHHISNPLVYSRNASMVWEFCGYCQFAYKKMLLIRAVEEMYGPAGLVPREKQAAFAALIEDVHGSMSSYEKQFGAAGE